MRPWQFRQKTPGFGLTKNYYMTVLAGSAVLPAPEQVANPKGKGGALEGFLVPLASTATKEDLERPMQRGFYAASTKDRKTVLRLVVVSKEEAGFDPSPFLSSPQAQGVSQELRSRISATWTLLQVTVETHDPMVYESLRFILGLCQRLAELSDGVVADPVAQTYRLPNEVFHLPPAHAQIDARDHVNIVTRAKDGEIWVHTLGLQKFALPELEMFGLRQEEVAAGQNLLMSLAQSSLLGNPPNVGDLLGAKQMPIQVAAGGLDRGTWEGIECFELIPPTGKTIGESILAWATEL